MNSTTFSSIGILTVLFLFQFSAAAQRIAGFSTRWSDTFTEWELIDVVADSIDPNLEPEELVVGTFQLRWLNAKEDWSEWEYEIAGERGVIKAKWRDDPTEWELRSYGGDIVNMKTQWANDFTEWRITNNDITLRYNSRWKNQYDEWEAKDSEYGRYQVKAMYSGDPRDWAITDEMEETIPIHLKLSMVFITAFFTSPR